MTVAQAHATSEVAAPAHVTWEAAEIRTLAATSVVAAVTSAAAIERAPARRIGAVVVATTDQAARRLAVALLQVRAAAAAAALPVCRARVRMAAAEHVPAVDAVVAVGDDKGGYERHAAST